VHHAEAWQHYLTDRRNTPADAEPQDQVIERLLASLTAVAQAANPEGHVLVVSHGAAIRTFVHAVTGTPPGPLANTALLQVSYGPSGFALVTSE
jgi:broad specificity phosphatase PhoE